MVNLLLARGRIVRVGMAQAVAIGHVAGRLGGHDRLLDALQYVNDLGTLGTAGLTVVLVVAGVDVHRKSRRHRRCSRYPQAEKTHKPNAPCYIRGAYPYDPCPANVSASPGL